MLPLFPLIFLAATAAPAGLVGRAMTSGSRRREILTFALIVIVTSLIAMTPETIAVLNLFIRRPNDLSPLIELGMHQMQALAAASLFAGLGWAVATGVQRLFED